MASSTPPTAPAPGAGGFQLFNLDTMSGVYPGTRTVVFQRLRLRPLAEPAATPHWARLLWYDSPPACVVELDARGPAANQPLVRLADPLAGDLRQRLTEALAAAGWQWLACGACVFWQPPTGRTGDGLPAATCTWHGATGDANRGRAPSPPLAVQSLLALDCNHWQPAGSELATPASTAAGAAGPDAVTPDTVIVKPLAKRAEREDDQRWTWWGRLRRALAKHSLPTTNPAQPAAAAPVPESEPASQLAPDARWEHQIVERSGVGAGTEPCFACQGRIANLGALAVASPEGDKQTLSIWRCRACYTYYLNDWIDRWERTDSLETEESYYRLAPQEALEVLALIDNVVHAEHPAGRFERTAQREWVLASIAQHPRLSHQIKQGR